MTRSMNTIAKPIYVKILCIDNNSSTTVQLQHKTSESITVKFENGIVLHLKRHHSISNLYIGASAGLEFQCKL